MISVEESSEMGESISPHASKRLETCMSALVKQPIQVHGLLDRFFRPVQGTLVLTTSQRLAKESAIRNCLRGNEQGHVNLWMLRELALSNGGLLTPELRQLAWPLLAGCHETILSHKIPSLVTPSASCLAALRMGVTKTKWNVEKSLRALREYRKSLDRQMILSIHSPKAAVVSPIRTCSSTKSVRFNFEQDRTILSPLTPKCLSDQTDEVEKTTSSHAAPPETVKTSPSNSTTSANESDTSEADSVKPMTIEVSWDVSYAPSRFTPKTQIDFRRPTSPAEQAALFRIIQQLLCSAPPSDSQHDDDQDRQYRFAPSLVDLTSLLWIHLQSPSLATLTLQNLASWQWRCTLTGVDGLDEALAKKLIQPLLQCVDPELAKYLMGTTAFQQTMWELARPWMNGSWLSELDMPTAARLMDAVIVSHALFPVYAFASLVTQNRFGIIASIKADDWIDCANMDENGDTNWHPTRLSLIEALATSTTTPAEAIESLVQQTLRTMKILPPKQLLKMIESDLASHPEATTQVLLESLHEISLPPSWAVSSIASTEFCRPKSVPSDPRFVLDENQWNLASTLADCFGPTCSQAKIALGLPDYPGLIRRACFVLVSLIVITTVHQVLPSSRRDLEAGLLVPRVTTAQALVGDTIETEVFHATRSMTPTFLNESIDFPFLPPRLEAGIPPIDLCLEQAAVLQEIKWNFVSTTDAVVEPSNETIQTEHELSAIDSGLSAFANLQLKHSKLLKSFKLLKRHLIEKIPDHHFDFRNAQIGGKSLASHVKRDLAGLWVWAKPSDKEDWLEYML